MITRALTDRGTVFDFGIAPTGQVWSWGCGGVVNGPRSRPFLTSFEIHLSVAARAGPGRRADGRFGTFADGALSRAASTPKVTPHAVMSRT